MGDVDFSDPQAIAEHLGFLQTQEAAMNEAEANYLLTSRLHPIRRFKLRRIYLAKLEDWATTF